MAPDMFYTSIQHISALACIPFNNLLPRRLRLSLELMYLGLLFRLDLLQLRVWSVFRFSSALRSRLLEERVLRAFHSCVHLVGDVLVVT